MERPDRRNTGIQTDVPLLSRLYLGFCILETAIRANPPDVMNFIAFLTVFVVFVILELHIIDGYPVPFAAIRALIPPLFLTAQHVLTHNAACSVRWSREQPDDTVPEVGCTLFSQVYRIAFRTGRWRKPVHFITHQHPDRPLGKAGWRIRPDER